MRFFVIFYFYSIVLFAQQSHWQPITISDGLSQGTVFDLLQDHEGYVWMATKASLNRYDGYSFKLFTTHSTPAYAITSNQTTALFEDSHKRLWIGTQNGDLNLYDARTQRFYHCFLDNKKKGVQTSGQHIFCIAEDSKGDIWVGTIVGGIFKVTLSEELRKGNFPEQQDFTSQIKVLTLKTSLPPTARINFIKLLKNNQLVVGSQAGYGQIDYLKNQYIPIIVNPVGTNRYLSIYEDADGTLVLTQPNQVLKIKNNKVEVLITRNPSIPTQMRVDGRGNVLILENKGLYKAHYTKLTPDVLNTPPLYYSENFVLFNALESDQQGNDWISTGGYGLLKEVPVTRKFEHHFKGRSIWTLLEDSHNRLITNHFKAFYVADRNNKENESLNLIFKDVHAVAEDGKGGFWQLRNDTVNYSKMTLTGLTKDFKAVRHYELKTIGIGENLGRMCKDKKGNLLITGIGSSLIQFDTLRKKFSYFSYKKFIPDNAGVYSNYLDGQGNVWICTQNGLLKAVPLSKGGYQFQLFKHDPHESNSIADDQVSMVLEDPKEPDNYLWIATHGGGLDRMSKKEGTFQHFTTKNGLPNDYVVGILADNNANLWLSTYYGLVQFNTQTFTATNFTSKDGLQSDEFAISSCFKNKAGEMMFAGVNGLNVFHPSDFNNKPKNIPLKINRLTVNNQEVLPFDKTGILEQSIEQTHEIDLSHDQNQVTFGFSLIDFNHASKNRFRSQLVGIDDDWMEAGTAHYVNFSQLPTGNYTFRLMGSADGSYWSKPIEIKLTVHPPFYRTWWAYLLYISLLTFIAYRFYQAQLNRVRLQEQLLYKDKEAERLAELDAIKTSFFANISHEFRTPLTLILGPMEQIVQDYAIDNRFPMIQRNAQRLLTLINQLLDISKLEAGQMKPEITQTELVRYFRTLTGSFISLAESRRLKFEVTQNQEDVSGYIDEDKVEKIITNLLSNAFKFTDQNGKVSVKINYSQNHTLVEIAISDTGIGIKQEQLDKIFNRFYQIEADHKRGYEGTGIGLALVKELVEVLKGTIKVESLENIGTTFKLKLPIDELTWKEQLTKGDLSTGNQPLKLTMSSVLPTAEPMLAGSNPNLKIENPLSDNVLLIIDDNADIRAYVRSIFEKEYQIVEAVDGQEGLELAIQNLPDIVICDLMMPRMDGFEFCQHLKTDERSSHIPVVMLTAKATLEDRIEGFEMGADEYLTKPFNKTEIQSRVRNLLRQRERLRHYFGGQPIQLQPVEAKMSVVEMAFLQKAKKIVEQNATDSTFGVEQLSTAIAMSQRQLVRKLKALTNYTTVEFIRHTRLELAADRLQKKQGNVSVIALELGFENLSYFAKVFQEKYGVLPSEYLAPSHPN